MPIFKNNREFDSTLAVFFVFAVFFVIVGAILTATFRGVGVSAELVNIFQSIKELVLMILSYFFTKAVAKEDKEQ